MSHDPHSEHQDDLAVLRPSSNDYAQKMRETLLLSKHGVRDLLALEDYLDELEVS
ncbi:MAG: hypothetical protein JKY92_04850 [Magnetovibrio sp.]|nr:hypothetical protein [Magnetovibrio sp.]